MNTYDQQYKNIVQRCLTEGILRPTRAGISAYSLIGVTIDHTLKEGFPLLTLRRLPEQSMRVETEFYLKGYTDKSWLIERGCHFWDPWQNRRSTNACDLGPTYGFEWRHFGAEYQGIGNYSGQGIDQIAWVLEKLKKFPENKRLVVSQWNPKDIEQQAIPPCPFAFQLLKHGEELNLIFYQRSGDVCIGVPNDFAQHALLLHLFCRETGYQEGRVVGMFGQVELYENHIDDARKLLQRESYPLPVARTDTFTSLFQWSYQDTCFKRYEAGERIRFPIAV